MNRGDLCLSVDPAPKCHAPYLEAARGFGESVLFDECRYGHEGIVTGVTISRKRPLTDFVSCGTFMGRGGQSGPPGKNLLAEIEAGRVF